MQQIISFSNSLRDDLLVILMFHLDTEQSDRTNIKYKIKTIGNLLEDKYNPAGTVDILLVSSARFNESNVPEYGFYTHKTLDRGVEIPAKSPMGMFNELFIPNDLKTVIEKINEFYN